MTKLFLSLEDAVKVAVREFDIDATLARQEFEQKCYISDDQYGIGYYDGVVKCVAKLSEELARQERRANDNH